MPHSICFEECDMHINKCPFILKSERAATNTKNTYPLQFEPTKFLTLKSMKFRIYQDYLPIFDFSLRKAKQVLHEVLLNWV